MNSDTCRKPPLGTFKSINHPINSVAGKRTEAYCFTASICLLRMTWSWATSVASYHRALAKGDEALWAPFDHGNTSNGHGMSTSKAGQMCQNLVNVLILDRLIFTPFHILKIKIIHIGFNVGL